MSNSVIDKIRQALDITQVIGQELNLVKKGNNFVALCPFHDDSRPSLIVSSQKQIFKCFSCGQGGDVISFYSDYHKVAFRVALEKLAALAGIDYKPSRPLENHSPEEQKILDALSDAKDFFMNALQTSQGSDARQYLSERQIETSAIEEHKIGYAPSDSSQLWTYLIGRQHAPETLALCGVFNRDQKTIFNDRIVFTLANQSGQVVGFSARTLDPQVLPKYLNSAQSPVFDKRKLLFNFHRAESSVRKLGEVLIVEGFLDVIALEKIGYPNVVALMGTSFSNTQLEMLGQVRVTLMLDGDAAGFNAMQKMIAGLVEKNLPVQISPLGPGQDPDQIFQLDQGETLKAVAEQKTPWLEFVYQKICPQNAQTPRDIEIFVEQIKPFLALANRLEWEFYLKKMVRQFDLSLDLLVQMMPFRSTNRASVSKSPTKRLDQPTQVPPPDFEKILIRSMLKNARLINLFTQSKLVLVNPDLNLIANYIVNYVQKPLIPEKIKQKCQEIIKESGIIAKTPDEFQAYLDRVKWINRRQLQRQIQRSLDQTKDPDVALKLLKEQIKLKKGTNN